MDENEARQELTRVMTEYRARPYQFWVSRVDQEPITFEFTTSTGHEYQVEINTFWDDEPEGRVVVGFAIDDGQGWRANFPMVEGFIICPDGSFLEGDPDSSTLELWTMLEATSRTLAERTHELAQRRASAQISIVDYHRESEAILADFLTHIQEFQPDSDTE